MDSVLRSLEAVVFREHGCVESAPESWFERQAFDCWIVLAHPVKMLKDGDLCAPCGIGDGGVNTTDRARQVRLDAHIQRAVIYRTRRLKSGVGAGPLTAFHMSYLQGIELGL